ncbi:MAG: DUF3313 domain-containing protein [Comamonas sp.]
MRLVYPSLIAACLVLAGCAGSQPTRYAQLESAPLLRPTLGDKHVPYRLNQDVDWSRYTRVIVDPVAIYTGQDHQFEDVSEDEKQALADYMRKRFRDQLKTRFRIVPDAAPQTLRLKLTLTGAKGTTAGISTFTRFDIGGGPYNWYQSVAGGEGTFTGSVSYAVEIFDAQSQQLLEAFVAKQYPNSMNVGATMGRMSAAQVGIDKGATALAAELQ